MLSIVLVTWNGWSLLERCLVSLSTAVRGLEGVEIIVVDNGSTDGTADALAAEYPRVRLVAVDGNLGFARANNLGAAEARGSLLLLLNNDTVVAPDAIGALLAAAGEHPEFDLFAPEMRQLARPDRVDNRGIYLDRGGHFRQLDSGAPVLPPRARCEIFGPSGGACLVRRGVVDDVGLFTGGLESYLEDADFAARARAARYRTLYVPESCVLHEGSATGERIADRKFYLIQRNMLAVWRHWFGTVPGRPSWWVGALYEVGQVARAAMHGRGAVALRAKRDAEAVAGLRAGGGARAGRSACDALHGWLGLRARPVAPPRAGVARAASRAPSEVGAAV